MGLPKGDTALSDRPLVEELGQEDCEVDCYFDQQLPKELTDEQASAVPITHGYGFACKRTGVFSRLLDECQHVFEIQGLDGKSFKDRRREREENESKCFSPDHYLADLHDPHCRYRSCWTKLTGNEWLSCRKRRSAFPSHSASTSQSATGCWTSYTPTVTRPGSACSTRLKRYSVRSRPGRSRNWPAASAAVRGSLT